MIDVVVGYSSDYFGNELANRLGCAFFPFRNEYYIEGAPAPRIAADYKDIEGKHVLTVYRTKQRPDRDMVCRFLTNYPRVVKSLCDKETFNASKVDVFHPYFVLGRQDHNPKTDEDKALRNRDAGKDVGYKYEIGLFKGANRLLTFHPHFHREPGEIDVDGVHLVCLDAVPAMVRYAKGMRFKPNTRVVSPDLSGDGEYSVAKSFAELAGLNFDHINKERVSSVKTYQTDELDVEGSDVFVVDDIANTLGTFKGSLKAIKNHGEIEAFFVHAVLPEGGHKLAQEVRRGGGGNINSISATNCIDSDYSSISIIDELVDFYKNNENDS